MHKLIPIIILLVALLDAAAVKKVKNEIDHIALATILLKDGHVQKADDELSKVDIKNEKIDFIKYYTLKALIATKNGAYAGANKFFLASLDAGQNDKSIFLYMAQNSFKLKEYQNTISYLQNAGELATQKASTFSLMAEAYWRLNEKEKALLTLAKGIGKFENEYSFIKQRFYYYMSLELYQSALEDANFYLQNVHVEEKDAIAFLVALRKAKEIDKAIDLAQKLHLKFTQSVELKVLLAHLYIDKEMIHAAAHFFDEASIYDENFTKESAEMYRRTKKFILALYKNSQLLDVKEKLKQKIAIYLEYGDYEKIIAAHNALYRSALIEDESIRYALAYSYYMVKDFDACENELKKLTKIDLFKKASELRKNIQKCKNEKWECEL